MTDPRDSLVRTVCNLLRVEDAQSAIELLARAGAEFRTHTLTEQKAAIARSLEETETTYAQAELVRDTGRGMSADEAKAVVALRKAGKTGPVEHLLSEVRQVALRTADQVAEQLGGIQVVSRVPTAIPGVTNRK